MTHPWEGLEVPTPVNAALVDIIERMLEEYALPWYSQITTGVYCDVRQV